MTLVPWGPWGAGAESALRGVDVGHSWSSASQHQGTDSAGHKRSTGLLSVFGCGHSKSWASGSAPRGLDVGGYRHYSKSLQSEPCKKDWCWDRTAPALGTTRKHLGWHPRYSMSPATWEVPKSGQVVPMWPGDSQTATACPTTRVSPKSRATALAGAVLPC